MKDIKQYGPIIAILLGVALVILSYMYGLQAYNKKSDEVKEEIKTLEKEYKSLKTMYDNKAEYEKMKSEYEEKYEELISKYDADITDESVSMDLVDIEQKAKVFVITMSMQEKTSVYEFGAMASNNPDNPQPTGINAGYAGLFKEYNVVAEGTYDNIKETLKAVINNSKRKVITSAAFSNDFSTGKVTVTMRINEYAVSGDDREASEVVIPPEEHSVGNIFGDDQIKTGEDA